MQKTPWPFFSSPPQSLATLKIGHQPDRALPGLTGDQLADGEFPGDRTLPYRTPTTS